MPLWVRPGSLTFPETPDTPVIMVGPGTGVAPFRAAVQERVARGQTGEHAGPLAGWQLGLPGPRLTGLGPGLRPPAIPQETSCSSAAAGATETSIGNLSGWSWRGRAA